MNTNKITKWSVIIGIVIVLNLFFNYTLSLVYKEPAYENFCKLTQVNQLIETQDQCVAAGGQWNPYPSDYYNSPKTAPIPVGTTSVRPQGYCDQQFTCRNDYDAARKIYDRNVFITLVVLGAIVVAVGNFFGGNEVIATGLSFGGVLSFVIASLRYWGAASSLIRVIILAIALALLFWVAYKRFGTKGQSPM